MNKTVHGVNVDLSHPDIKGAKTVADLKKLELYSHLPADQQKEAYEDLLKAISEAGKPATEAKKDEVKNDDKK